MRAAGPAARLGLVAIASGLLAGCSGASPTTATAAVGSARASVSGTPAAAATTEAPSSTGASTTAARGQVPVQIALPSIGITSDIVPVLDKDRVLLPPARPWDVGWWSRGVGVDASEGTAVLAVHLDSRRYGAGPFTRLGGLHRGDALTIVDRDGREHRFLVSSLTTYPKSSAPWAVIFDQHGPGRVVLVTCGGTYRRDAGGWDSNVVAVFTPA